MQLNPNLAFNGNAEEVLAHYRDALGGDVQITRFGETPIAQQLPPEWAGKVVYGTLHSPAGAINVMDAPPGRGEEPGGNFMLGIQSESREQIDEIRRQASAVRRNEGRAIWVGEIAGDDVTVAILARKDEIRP